MKLLFFDMEFANGQVPGSIYSFGYLVTNEAFEILVPPTDLLVNPEAPWNAYVVEHILAYPKEEVEAAPAFPAYYERLRALFAEADVAVGFAVSNDIRALKSACARYALEPIRFATLDMEKICRNMEEHREAHGLAGYVRAWCGAEPLNQHRSDGDALATMHLLRAICKEKHVTPEMMQIAFPEAMATSVQAEKRAKKPMGRHRHHKKGGRNKSKAAPAAATVDA